LDVAYAASDGASRVCKLTIDDILALNKLVRHLKATNEQGCLFIARLPKDCDVKIVGICDAALGNQGEEGTRSQGGRLCGFMPDTPGAEPGPFAFVDGRSGHIRRVGRSSFDIETLEAVSTMDTLLTLALLWEESVTGPRPSLLERKLTQIDTGMGGEEPAPLVIAEIHCDGEGTCKKTANLRIDPSMSKARKLDIADIKDCIAAKRLKPLVHISGKKNPSNPLTKKLSPHEYTSVRLRELLRTGWYEPQWE
jgi:hypothetical protein